MLDFNFTRWELQKNADGSPSNLLVTGQISDPAITTETRYAEFSVPGALLETMPLDPAARAAAIKDFLAGQIKDAHYVWTQELKSRPPAPASLNLAGVQQLFGDTKIGGIKSHAETGTKPSRHGSLRGADTAPPSADELNAALGLPLSAAAK